MTLVGERLRAQLLSGRPARSAREVAQRLLAVQAQDPRGARLAVRARASGLTAADIDRALTQDRSLVVSWLNRGTLHLVCVEDLPLLHALTTPQLHVGNARRLAEEGVTPDAADRGTAVIADALADGPQTRPDLRERLRSADVPVDGQALVHLLLRACLLGIAVRGPVVGSEHAYVGVRDWLGFDLTPPPDRDRALSELARRYLIGHGPATDRDLGRWAGIGLGDARRALGGLPRLVDRGDGLVSLKRPHDAPPPPPLLLGPFEPLLLGWGDRTPIVGAHDARIVSGGMFRPFALVDGRALATWTNHADVRLQPFEPLSAEVMAALHAEAAAVRRFFDGARYR